MPHARLALLLPPSEGKAPGGDGPGWAPSDGALGAALGERRRMVVEALLAVGGGDQKLLGVGGEHLLRAQQANRRLLGSPTMPAGRRYTGVVWDHLDPGSLPAAVRRRIGNQVAIVSGLHGLTLAEDPLPDYRLKMGARLAPLGLLSTWWRPVVTEAIEQWARGRTVVDLLPKEHRAAWTPRPGVFQQVIRVDLVESGPAGQVRVVGHEAKAAKGALARHLVLTGGDPREALRTWTHPRFSLQYDPTGL